MQRLTSKKTYLIVFLTTLFVLSISFYSNKDFYKQYIINKIYSAIDFQVLFQDSSISLFPAPGIILEKVSIHNLEAKKKINAEIEKIHFLFSWKILFGEVELNSIEINGGKIELADEEKRTEDSINSKVYDVKSIQKIFTFLNLDSISFHSTQFIYKKNITHLDDFFINSLTISTDHISLISLNADMNYQTGNFKSETKIQYTNNNHSSESLEIESKWKFKNVSLKPLKDYYKLIVGANFDNTTLNGEFTVFKEKFKNQYNIKIDTSISNLFFSGDPVYPTITANSDIEIAQSVQPQHIVKIANKLNIDENDLFLAEIQFIPLLPQIQNLPTHTILKKSILRIFIYSMKMLQLLMQLAILILQMMLL